MFVLFVKCQSRQIRFAFDNLRPLCENPAVERTMMPPRFFPFDELTFPEVAALPRDLPLILPLGFGYDQAALASLLGDPLEVALLPALPFGWRGSGLETPRPVFSTMVRNLLANMSEDGFTRVYALSPDEGALAADIPQLVLRPSPSAGAGPAPLPADGKQAKVVLIPVGHTEQHGYHSPLSTDTIIIEAIMRGTAASAPELASCLPAYPYGVSTHRPYLDGTFNVGGRAFEDFWGAVIDTLVGRGFSRFYLNSGHGGNVSFLVTVVKYAGERHPDIFAATTGLYLNSPEGIRALEQKRESPIGGMGHACELETSLVLALRPELIHIERAVDEVNFISTPSYYMDWIEGGALIANPPWDDDTKTGAYGAGSLGRADKGDYWLSVAIAEKVGHCREIQEQYQRRRAVHTTGTGGQVVA
jgi:creatinine amidohydrolase